MTFRTYMNDYCKEHHVKKSDIARATGISEHYIYKLFRGLKRTGIRDYVLAMCRAMGMDVVETQIALTLNNMPVLSPSDRRDSVLIRCIMDNRNIRMTNVSLEENGMKELKVRRDA